jgi:uncharacterized membrane protein YsdA (DUF1294 family)/cold shock CspA family protein
MRLNGNLKSWNDEKGFGFILPCLGGPEVFVHISSFQNRSRRPKVGDLVVYEAVKGANGKIRASSVSFSCDTMLYTRVVPSERGLVVSLLIALIFLVAISILGLVGRIPHILVLLYFAASFVAFLMYWHDKSSARKGRWRTQESTLLLCGLLGGWPGALIAQRLFRHKSSKVEFQVSFWITVTVNCCALGWLLSPSGAEKLSALMLASG